MFYFKLHALFLAGLHDMTNHGLTFIANCACIKIFFIIMSWLLEKMLVVKRLSLFSKTSKQTAFEVGIEILSDSRRR